MDCILESFYCSVCVEVVFFDIGNHKKPKKSKEQCIKLSLKNEKSFSVDIVNFMLTVKIFLTITIPKKHQNKRESKDLIIYLVKSKMFEFIVIMVIIITTEKFDVRRSIKEHTFIDYDREEKPKEEETESESESDCRTKLKNHFMWKNTFLVTKKNVMYITHQKNTKVQRISHFIRRKGYQCKRLFSIEYKRNQIESEDDESKQTTWFHEACEKN